MAATSTVVREVSFLDGNKVVFVRIDARGGWLYRTFNASGSMNTRKPYRAVPASMREYLELHHSDIISELGAEVDATETPDICPTWGAGCGGCYNCR